jgi:hypothetical protein
MRRDDTSGGVDLNDATKMSAADDDTSWSAEPKNATTVARQPMKRCRRRGMAGISIECGSALHWVVIAVESKMAYYSLCLVI